MRVFGVYCILRPLDLDRVDLGRGLVRLVDRRRIKCFRFSQSAFQFGKASIEFIVIHFLHDAEYVLDDQRVLEHLQVPRQRIERPLLVGELVLVITAVRLTERSWL